jgi:hypothetical protein
VESRRHDAPLIVVSAQPACSNERRPSSMLLMARIAIGGTSVV